MHKQIAIKAAMLTPMVVTTWVITSFLIGHMKSKVALGGEATVKASSDNQPFKPPLKRQLNALGERRVALERNGFSTHENRPAMAEGLPERPRSITSFNRFDVNVDGRKVSVKGAISIDTVRRDLVYVWRLRVYAVGVERPMRELAYTDQAFEIDPSGKMEPTFSESFQLPPGKYRVRLSLQRLAGGIELGVANLAGDQGAVGATKVIEIK